MAYRPKSIITTAAAQEVIAHDPKRTTVVISNLSGETCYWGVDGTVSNTGPDQGAPIFNNGRAEFSFANGRDPRIPRFVIGTAGASKIIIDEEFADEPSGTNETLNKILEELRRLK